MACRAHWWVGDENYQEKMNLKYRHVEVVQVIKSRLYSQSKGHIYVFLSLKP